MKRLLKISFLILLFCFAANAQQWSPQSSGTTATLRSVKAVDNNIVWAAGDNGLVLNTSDGGTTWIIKTPTQTSFDNYGNTSFDINTAIVIGCTWPPGTGAKIWKTTDSGNTWMEKYYSANNWANNIHFFDSNNGIYIGDPDPYNSAQWNILTTTDQGNSWNRVPQSNYPPSDSACGEYGLIRSYGASGDTIWFSTYYEYCSTKNNRIFRSTDRGYNWTTFNMPYQGYTGGWISFSSSTYGVAISNPYGLVSRTADAGTTWTIIDTIGISPWAVRNVPGYPNFFLAVGEDASTNGTSYYSNDSGYFWDILSPPLQSILLDVSLTQDSAWAVGNSGTILTLDIEPILPVELTSFTAISQAGNVTLNWITATEINNLGFEIERKIIQSEFEGQWVRIGFKEGYGTTTEPKEYSFVDDISGIAANSLSYRLIQIDFDGTYEYSDEVLVDNPAPLNYALQQNYPNPFNPATTISYSLPLKSQVELVIYNTLGESVIRLVNEEKEAGKYSVKFDATNLPSGIYFYRLQAGSFVETKKMVLMK